MLLALAAFALPASSAQALRHRNDGSVPAPAQIVQQVTNVPASTLDQVGAGKLAGPDVFSLYKLNRNLRSHGKPEVLTLNLAWCPHCAANSWALAVALSRFGTLTGLRVIDSGTHYCTLTHDPCSLSGATPPCYPHTHGLSFLDAAFHSPYLSLGTVVFQDVKGNNLENPTPRQLAAMNQFDPLGQTPALDVGGAFAFLNSGYDPGALAHKTWSQIAGSLADPHNPIARHIDGLANLFTAAMCRVTKGKPGAVCRARGVRAAARRLAHAAPPPPPPPGSAGAG